MTTPAKPLTADEIGAMKAADMPMFTREEGLRLIATIEQQAEQIEKLRNVIERCLGALLYTAAAGANPNRNFLAKVEAKFCDAYEVATKALAATEPVNDKR